MLIQIHDRTRDETYTTDNYDNALRFVAGHRARHPAHVIELWRQRLNGTWEKVSA
jgi:hypothetical protein